MAKNYRITLRRRVRQSEIAPALLASLKRTIKWGRARQPDFTTEDESTIREAARRLSEAFATTPNSTAKVALATELFGKDWLGSLRRLEEARLKLMAAGVNGQSPGSGSTDAAGGT